MHLFSLLVYLFSTGIALIILYSSFSLYRKFLLPCLQHYLYFLSAFLVAGFIDLIGNTLGKSFFAGQPAEAVRLLEHIFIFLKFPFLPFAIYFFILFNADFLQRKISSRWLSIFTSFWVVFFLLLVLATKGFSSGQGDRLSVFLIPALARSVFSFYLLTCAYFLLSAKKIERAGLRKTLRTCCLLYLFGFGISFSASEIALGASRPAQLLTIVLYFSLNIPPLLLLRRHFRKYSFEIDGPHPALPDTLESISSEYGLTKREAEILRYILDGKSSYMIKGELFISLHTVKNHIYHIYQKLGVKNRLQLWQLIRKNTQNRTRK